MNLGYIGTGTMGNPMSRCLLEGGHQLTVHDLRREATTNLCEMGANWADNPRAVAEASDVVFTSLPGPAEMEQVALDPSTGILSGLRPGKAYVDTTTNSPTVFRRVAEVCRSQGIEVLDAPVSGRPPNMTIMVGGDRAVFEKHLPVLECMGKNIFYVGETGAACTAKLVTQYMGYCNFITAVEGMLIAAKAGIDLNILADIVPESAGASRAFNRFPSAVLRREFGSSGTLDIIAKDLHLACELAREVQGPAQMGIIAEDLFVRAQAQGWGKWDFPAVVQVLEQMAGAELRAPMLTGEGT